MKIGRAVRVRRSSVLTICLAACALGATGEVNATCTTSESAFANFTDIVAKTNFFPCREALVREVVDPELCLYRAALDSSGNMVLTMYDGKRTEYGHTRVRTLSCDIRMGMMNPADRQPIGKLVTMKQELTNWTKKPGVTNGHIILNYKRESSEKAPDADALLTMHRIRLTQNVSYERRGANPLVPGDLRYREIYSELTFEVGTGDSPQKMATFRNSGNIMIPVDQIGQRTQRSVWLMNSTSSLSGHNPGNGAEDSNSVEFSVRRTQDGYSETPDDRKEYERRLGQYRAFRAATAHNEHGDQGDDDKEVARREWMPAQDAWGEPLVDEAGNPLWWSLVNPSEMS